MNLTRLVVICLILRSGEKATAHELSKRFKVNLRTIYRDIETLQRIQIPITSNTGPNGGYRLNTISEVAPKLFGSIESLIDFLTTSLAIRNSTMSRADLFNKITKEASSFLHIDKKLELSSGDRILFDIKEWYWRDKREKYIELLKDAVFNNNILNLEYHERNNYDLIRDRIEPYGLVWKGGAWYLIGLSSYYKKIHRIRSSRILKVENDNKKFKRPENFNLAHFWATNMDSFGKGDVRVVLRIEKSAFEDFEYFGLKDTSVVERLENYWLVTLFVDRWEWLIPLILSYSGDVIVLEPESLKKQIIDEIQTHLSAQLLGENPIKREFGPSDIRARATRGRDYS